MFDYCFLTVGVQLVAVNIEHGSSISCLICFFYLDFWLRKECLWGIELASLLWH